MKICRVTAAILLALILMTAVGVTSRAGISASPVLPDANAQTAPTWENQLIAPRVPYEAAVSSLALDSSGYPHICYYDGSEHRNLKYASWDQSNLRWNIQIVAEYVAPQGCLSLALDSNNDPHICYSNGGLEYAHWTGSSWDIQIVDLAGGSVGSIALGHYNTPFICYFDGWWDIYGYLKVAYPSYEGWTISTLSTSQALFWGISMSWNGALIDRPSISYATCTSYPNEWELQFRLGQEGTWNPPVTVDTAAAYTTTSLAVDSDYHWHIGYNDGNENLKYAEGDYLGGTWNKKTVDATGTCYYPSLAVGWGDGRARIGYYDIVNNHLKYAYWNGLNWNIQTVGTATIYAGWMYWCTTSIALDSTGRPYISYCDNYNYQKLATRYSFGWSTEYVDPGLVGYRSSIGWDTYHICVSYADFTGMGSLKYARRSMYGFASETVDSTEPGDFSSLAIDVNHNPHISYYGTRSTDLKYATWTGSDWSIQTVDLTGNVGYYTSLALDASGYPHISYMDFGYFDLRYAHWTGSDWSIEIVDATGDTGFTTSLALDSSGYPHISYYDRTNGDLRYAHWTGSAWDKQTVDSTGNTGQYTSLVLDSHDFPHISYHDYTNKDLRYAHWTGSAWDKQTVDSTGSVGESSSLALRLGDSPHITYADATNGDLKYARWNGVAWDIYTVDESAFTGECGTSLLRGAWEPCISYYDSVNNELEYANALITDHDVAVTNITPFKTVVGQGYSTSINVTVQNQGNGGAETFDVALYADTILIGTQTVTSLEAWGAAKNITFIWDTSSFAKGNYPIKAVASTVPYEVDTPDNTLIAGSITITIPGDVDGDSNVDFDDFVVLAGAYGSTIGQPGYNSAADIDGDGDVDYNDFIALAGNYGQQWP